MKHTYTFIDLETTGLDYKTDQIIEVATIRVDKNLNEIDRKQTFVALEGNRKLPEFITQLTGITEDDLKSDWTEQMVLTDLAYYIGDSIVVSHFAPFDLSFLYRGGIIPKRFICTRALVTLLEPEKSPSLKDVCERIGVDLRGHHRAMNDVEATLSVFKHYSKLVDNIEVYLNVVVDTPERPLSFIPYGAIVKRLKGA